jgi:predicted Zn-dependent protease
MKIFPFQLRTVAWLLAFAILPHFAPQAAVTRLVILSPEHERQVGLEAFKEVEKEFGSYPGSAALAPYLDAIAAKLGAQSRRKDLSWRVVVLDTPQVYAFPLPAGTICISRGLLVSLASEGETATALAHEMAHVALRHDTLRVTGSDLASFMQGTLAHYTPDLVKRMDGAVNLALGLALCGYVTPQEEEADAETLLMLQKAGYNPACAAAFHRKLLVLEEKEPGRTERYLLSHIATQGRLEKALLVAGAPAADCGTAAHAAACAGLPLGKTAGDAFLAGGVYVNKPLRVRLEAPNDYDAHFAPPEGVVRLARTVRPGDGVVPAEFILEVIPEAAEKSADAAADGYIRSRGIEGSRKGDRSFKTNDGRALDLRIYEHDGQNGRQRTFLAVAVEGDTAYILRGTAHMDRYKTDFPALMGIIKSFRILTAEEAAAAQPPKVGG